jgi:hypothetical protein
MPFSIIYDEATRTVRVKASETVSRDDVIELLTEHWARLRPDWALLLDTSGSTPLYATGDVHEFVARTIEVARDRHPVLAIVAANADRYRFVRQYQLRCEISGCKTVEVFKTTEDAERWLTISREYREK